MLKATRYVPPVQHKLIVRAITLINAPPIFKVIGLARSDQSADQLTSLGASVVRGTLEDLDIIRSAASSSDGVIHCGFIKDHANFANSIAVNKNVVEAIASVLEGTNKPYIHSSAAIIMATTPSRLSTEVDEPDWNSLTKKGPLGVFAQTEQYVLGLKDKGIRSVAIRPAPSVHGKGEKGFITSLIQISKKNGVAGYLGDGDNVWPAVHQLDAARLYVLALEKAEAGTALHAVAEEGVKMKDIMAVIGKNLGVAVEGHVAPETLAGMAMFAGLDVPTSSAITRKTLGWEPTQKGLLADVEEFYF